MSDREMIEAVRELSRNVEALVKEMRLARGGAVEPECRDAAVHEWLQERCTTLPHPALGREASERSIVLYADFVAWCEDREVAPPTITAFGRQLTELGFPRKKRQGVFYRAGLRLLSRQDSCRTVERRAPIGA